jgi:FixJ family two-component response regulator
LRSIKDGRRRLPPIARMFDASPQNPRKTAKGMRRPEVVIVEDDDALLGALKFSLEAEGYDVRAFLGETDILAHPNVVMGASCVVVDYRLTPLDGLELLALFQARGFKGPAILVTTNPDDRCRREAHRLGARVVEKPLLNDALSHVIEDLLAARSVR